MPDQVLSSSTIAKSVKTNPVVIRRLLQDLVNHKLIRSTGGARGGFSLAKDAADISLWDIYLATREDDFFKRPKINPECIVSSNLNALVFDVFNEAEYSMKTVLEKTSITDLDNNLKEIINNHDDTLGTGHNC